VGNAVLVGFGDMLGAADPGKKEKKKLHDDCNDCQREGLESPDE
jgi:hypothetical protein